MTSVRSHRLPSSGNKWLIYLLSGLIWGACSPKIRPVVKPVEKKPTEVEKVPETKVVPKVTAPKVATISLILPFELDKLDLTLNATRSGLAKADLAVEYYQGFKLALDSLAVKGNNFKLLVYDSKGEASQGHGLANNTKIRNSDLIVGPVFPETIKAFISSISGINKPVVSPLSPSAAGQYKYNNLITAAPPLEYHAWRVARYIKERIDPVKVIVLKSGYSDENKYLTPFRKAIDSLGKKQIKVIYFTVVRGNLDALIPELSQNEENIFVVPSTDQPFLTITLTALGKLSDIYPVTLFGHPSWAKASFLHTDLLQKLKTHITATDKINYKAASTNKFIKAYRHAYHTEPGEYAIKGFDEGYYFGTLLSNDTDPFKRLNKFSYDGMHNQFNFIKINGSGWINTHVSVYKYQNFELKHIE